MKKNLGILAVIAVVFIVTAIGGDGFLSAFNMYNLVERISLYAIIGIGVSFVIVTGGIDLSIGSFIGLCAVTFPFLVINQGMSLTTGLLMLLTMSVCAGLFHGLLVTKLDLQPFVVTLCTLMMYRGLARHLVSDSTMGYSDERFQPLSLMVGRLSELPWFQGIGWARHVPVALLIMIVIGVLSAVFLNRTIYGRYLMALGRNREAALLSGINTTKMIILAYVLCSVISGFGALLFALDVVSVQPSTFGSFYELYAIAAAVLGGCSLRGGEGSIFGVILGAALMRLLMNSIQMLGVSDALEEFVIGFVILLGVIIDVIVKRVVAKRRARQQAAVASAAE